MSLYSSQVPVGSVVVFTYPQPFNKGKGGQLFKITGRKPADPTTRETVIACDKNGTPLPGAREHGVTLEFVDPVQ